MGICHSGIVAPFVESDLHAPAAGMLLQRDGRRPTERCQSPFTRPWADVREPATPAAYRPLQPAGKERDIATIPLESVGFRAGAVPDRTKVIVLEDSAAKTETGSSEANGAGVGLDLEAVLSVKAQVADADGTRYCWIDVHVFDEHDRLIQSETLPMRYVGAAEDGGCIFGFEGSVFRGTGASPGSVWLAPDARKLQYRLHYEVAGTVFSDGLLRQHDLAADGALTRSGKPAKPARRPRATASPG